MADEVLRSDKDLASLTEFEALTQQLAAHKDNVLARLKGAKKESESAAKKAAEDINAANSDTKNEKPLLSKKHWMPDRTCKVCYDCEAPFTLFRRRHHCRICGQIFCNDCSSHMVDGKLYNIQGSVRVCNYCFNQQLWRIQESSSGREYSDRRESPSASIVSASAHLASASSEGVTARHGHGGEPVPRALALAQDGDDQKRTAGQHIEAAEDGKNEDGKEETDDCETDNMISGRYWLDQKDINNAAKMVPSLLNVPAAVQPVTFRIGLAGKDEKSGRLNTIADAHLQSIVSRLVEEEAVELRWINPLLKLIRTAVAKIKTSVRRGDKMDLRSYVKIKTIPGGQITDSRFIEGVVFRKNVAHKKMRRKIKEPRVLLLSCPIQFKGEHLYQQGGNRMSSLMTLIDQERLHLAIVVNKIVQLQPDVLVVQQTVSRIAQDSLREAGISLVLNVKASVMERLARSTGGHILRSPDYVENSLLRKDQLFGHCRDFEVKHFTEKGGKRTTLMFFECTRTHRHGTICLRGATKEQLKKVKRVLRMGILVAHNLKMETAFLNDECAMYSEEEFNSMLSVYAKEEAKIEELKKRKSDHSPTRRTTKIAKQLDRMQQLLKAHKDPAERILSISPGIKIDISDPYVRRRTRQAVETCGALLQSISYGKFTRLEHNWQCEAPREDGHVFYDPTDITLGRFLEVNCFDMERRCANSKCRRNVLYHNRYLTHGRGRIHFTVKLLDSQTACELYTTKGNSGGRDSRRGSKDEQKSPGKGKGNGAGAGKREKAKAHAAAAAARTMSTAGAAAAECKAAAGASGPASPQGKGSLATGAGPLASASASASPPSSAPKPGGQQDAGAEKKAPSGAENDAAHAAAPAAATSSVAAAFSSAVAAARRAAAHAAAEAMGPSSPTSGNGKYHISGNEKILVCSFCRECDNRGPVVALSEDAYNMSFGKFLDLSFYNHRLRCRTGSCKHSLHASYVRQFVKGNMIAQFQYDPIRPFKISFEHRLKYDLSKQIQARQVDVNVVKRVTAALIAAFSRRVEDLKVYLEIDIEDAKVREPELVGNRKVLLTAVKELGCEIEQTRISLSDELQKYGEIPAGEPSFELNRIRRAIFERFHDWNYTMTRIRKPFLTHVTAKGRRGELQQSQSRGTKASLGKGERGTDSAPPRQAGAPAFAVKSTPTSPQKGKSASGRLEARAQNFSAGADSGDASGGGAAAAARDVRRGGDDSRGGEGGDGQRTESAAVPRRRGSAPSDGAASSKGPKADAAAPFAAGKPRLGSCVDAIRLCQKVNPVEILGFDKSLSSDDLEFLSSGTVDHSSSGEGDSSQRNGSSADHKRMAYDAEAHHVPCRVHMLLPRLLNDAQIPIFEDESSSIIAYGLASVEHARKIQQSATSGIHLNGTAATSDSGDAGGESENIGSRETTNDSKLAAKSSGDDPASKSTENPSSASSDSSKVGNAARLSPKQKKADIFSPSWYFNEPKAVESILTGKEKNPHLELKFSDLAKHGTFNANPSTITKFQCKIYFARKFHALRHVFCGGEAGFIRSMSRCMGWNATGGKSGSTFARTRCQRYIIKFVTRSEFKMLTDLAPSYFQFMAKALFHQLPTVLSKILGCYQVSWRRSNGDQVKTLHAIVMPNVFYSTPVTHIFDLKGSVRNRYVKRKAGETDRVLLDENFLEYTRGFPIPVEEKTKDEMRHAIRNDSKFLCDRDIVDYSVLVGLNESTRVMAIGIIDYVRQYTWERRIETGVKSISMMTGKASPTVISPDNYKVRFQLATERYFMMSPCQTSRAGLPTLPTFTKRPLSRLGFFLLGNKRVVKKTTNHVPHRVNENPDPGRQKGERQSEEDTSRENRSREKRQGGKE